MKGSHLAEESKKRRDWVHEYAAAHPEETVQKVRKMMEEKFGRALGDAYISEALKAAREKLE